MNEVGTRRESLGQFRSRLLDQLGRRRVNYYEDLPLRERLEGFRPAKRLTAAGNRRSELLLQQVALPGYASVLLRKVAKAGNCVGRHSRGR